MHLGAVGVGANEGGGATERARILAEMGTSVAAKSQLNH
jgi:hypothetical protein